MNNEVKLNVRQEEPAIKLGTDVNAFVITFAMVKEAEIGTRWARERTTCLGFSTPEIEAKVIDKDADGVLVKITTDDDGKKTTALQLIKTL